MGELAFIVATEQTKKGWLVKVNVSYEGQAWHHFRDRDKQVAERAAQAFIAGKRSQFLKSQAAIESRKAGRYRSLVTGARSAREAGE